MSFTFGTQAQGQLDDSRSREESQEAWKNKLSQYGYTKDKETVKNHRRRRSGKGGGEGGCNTQTRTKRRRLGMPRRDHIDMHARVYDAEEWEGTRRGLIECLRSQSQPYMSGGEGEEGSVEDYPSDLDGWERNVLYETPPLGDTSGEVFTLSQVLGEDIEVLDTEEEDGGDFIRRKADQLRARDQEKEEEAEKEVEEVEEAGCREGGYGVDIEITREEVLELTEDVEIIDTEGEEDADGEVTLEEVMVTHITDKQVIEVDDSDYDVNQTKEEQQDFCIPTSSPIESGQIGNDGVGELPGIREEMRYSILRYEPLKIQGDVTDAELDRMGVCWTPN